MICRPASAGSRSTMVALLLLVTIAGSASRSQDRTENSLAVIAYYRGNASDIQPHQLDQVTHICYSFLHMKGNALVIGGARDSIGITRLVSLKKGRPGLKILISFGGWGGCPTCSEVFSHAAGRREFARSTKELLERFGADGIDLDWEYPAIEGYPGHAFSPDDRRNFTLLVRELRAELGESYELTFAAGAFTECLRNSVEWMEIMKVVDRVHLMTYDLVNGFSTVTGHHTPLLSTPRQPESTDSALRFLDSIGVGRSKMVIGAAFYARAWENVRDTNHGLFQTGKFFRYAGFKDLGTVFSARDGYVTYWDSTACAPYSYSAAKKVFATFDNVQSITLKTQYAIDKGVGGIMFWELTGDSPTGGLLEAIDKTKRAHVRIPR